MVRRRDFPEAGVAEPALNPAQSIESYIADPVGSYIKGRTFAVFWATESLNGLVLWGRPDESDVEIVVRALATDLCPHVGPHAAFIDMRRLEALDLRAFEKLASFLASRAERLGQVLTGRALLLGTGVMTTSVAAFYSAMSPDVPVQSFVDPSSALAWLGVRSQTVAEQIERLAGGAPEDGGMLAAARARLNKNSASTLKDLARQIGTSPRTLQRRLRDLGTTFQLEARHARLELAKRLLRDTNYSIKWIALECGCASLQHFSAFFREHEGVPPSRWRVGQTMVSRAAAGVIS